MHLCILCAQHKTTCCLSRDILVTLPDIQRIAAHIGKVNFFEFRRPASEDYLDQGADPNWNSYTVYQDGSRRVLKQGAGGNCLFLADEGCRLPQTVRPLVCRLHPMEYTEQRFTGLAGECPTAFLRAGESLLDNLEMSMAESETLRAQLYNELRRELATTPKAA